MKTFILFIIISLILIHTLISTYTPIGILYKIVFKYLSKDDKKNNNFIQTILKK